MLFLTNRIRQLRNEKGLTLKQLADEFNKFTEKDRGTIKKISYATLSRWENGTNDPPSKSLEKLANYFDVPVGYLSGVLSLKKDDDESIEKDLFKLLSEETKRSENEIKYLEKLGQLATLIGKANLKEYLINNNLLTSTYYDDTFRGQGLNLMVNLIKLGATREHFKARETLGVFYDLELLEKTFRDMGYNSFALDKKIDKLSVKLISGDDTLGENISERIYMLFRIFVSIVQEANSDRNAQEMLNEIQQLIYELAPKDDDIYRVYESRS